MFAIAMLVLRYIFLLLLLVFIFRLVKWMIGDLRNSLKPGDTWSFNREITFGRGSANDIVINNSFASQNHARVFLKNGQYWLEDLGSTNGTFLDEVRIKEPAVLANGDQISVGGVTFQFVRWGYEVGSDN